MSSAVGRPYRLAVVDTNPVQYRVPLWRAIAASGRFDLEVFFATKAGLVPAKVEGFGQTWTWDIPLLDGYSHRFLPTRRVPFLKGPTENHYPLGLPKIFRQSPFDAILVNRIHQHGRVGGNVGSVARRVFQYSCVATLMGAAGPVARLRLKRHFCRFSFGV